MDVKEGGANKQENRIIETKAEIVQKGLLYIT